MATCYCTARHHSEEYYAEVAAVSRATSAAREQEMKTCVDCGHTAPANEMCDAVGVWFCTPCGMG